KSVVANVTWTEQGRQRHLELSPWSPGRKTGFTLIEAMVVFIILAVIAAALVMTLRVGDFAQSVGSSKADICSDVKMLMDWIVRDVRQAKIQELFNNTPSTGYIKFNLWVWDNDTLAQVFSDQYVEYEYDSAGEVLTRRFIDGGVTVNEWNFTGVMMPPFYTSYTNETINSFSNATLLNSRKVIVAIKRGKTVRNRPLNFTMAEEVRIRNE
ncbi:MAG: prepilin-type N-terminal cleavage/methylation domain-containing protein, partial [Candidatus Omnitrophica bacterium]|nr:prepilin-type N-terminal cleavage/methylation domain-containing protein [Candidatus Omnitrophota bacterium]